MKYLQSYIHDTYDGHTPTQCKISIAKCKYTWIILVCER